MPCWGEIVYSVQSQSQPPMFTVYICNLYEQIQPPSPSPYKHIHITHAHSWEMSEIWESLKIFPSDKLIEYYLFSQCTATTNHVHSVHTYSYLTTHVPLHIRTYIYTLSSPQHSWEMSEIWESSKIFLSDKLIEYCLFVGGEEDALLDINFHYGSYSLRN